MSFDFKFKSYGKDWENISEACKKRDGYKCRKCGAEGYKIGGTAILHAAHIKSFAQGGKNILSNLTTRCVKCHSAEKGHSHMKANPHFKKQIKNQKKKFTF